MNNWGRSRFGGCSRLSGKELVKAQHRNRVLWVASLRKAANKRAR